MHKFSLYFIDRTMPIVIHLDLLCSCLLNFTIYLENVFVALDSFTEKKYPNILVVLTLSKLILKSPAVMTSLFNFSKESNIGVSSSIKTL